MPREKMLDLLDDAATEVGMPAYFHINGVDVLAISASKKWDENLAWLEGAIGRKLSLAERLRSTLIRTAVPVVSQQEGADKRFGVSGEAPYLVTAWSLDPTPQQLSTTRCSEFNPCALATLPCSTLTVAVYAHSHPSGVTAFFAGRLLDGHLCHPDELLQEARDEVINRRRGWSARSQH